MTVEVEVKLRIPDEHTAELICEYPDIKAGMLEPWSDIEMRSVYYDTPERGLSDRKWTLRLRCENGRSVAAFKQLGKREGSLFTREEIQVMSDGIQSAAARLVELGAPPELLEMGEFVESCNVDFTRRCAKVKLSDDSVIEVAVDSGIIRAGNKSEAVLELELELIAGEPELMALLGAELEKKYGLAKEYNSKYMRALRMLRSRK